MEKPKCAICDSEMAGRRGKVYCSPNCKSAAQYERKRNEETLFFKVDKKLKTNRKLLKKYNKLGKTVLRREILDKEGFDPNYFTHFRKTINEDIYFYCYDFGFMKTEEITPNELKYKYLIVNWNGK